MRGRSFPHPWSCRPRPPRAHRAGGFDGELRKGVGGHDRFEGLVKPVAGEPVHRRSRIPRRTLRAAAPADAAGGRRDDPGRRGSESRAAVRHISVRDGDTGATRKGVGVAAVTTTALQRAAATRASHEHGAAFTRLVVKARPRGRHSEAITATAPAAFLQAAGHAREAKSRNAIGTG